MANNASPAPLGVQRKDGKIYSPIRKRWLIEKPEEQVRQEYVCVLVNEFGYTLDQLSEELDVTGRGAADARADIVVWRSQQEKLTGGTPLIVVECKSDNVAISDKDYLQGELYARMTGTPFFVTHNRRETRYWRVLTDKMPGYRQEIAGIPHAGDGERQIKELLDKLRAFREDEFSNLLHKCHNIIRNREHLDPAAAFDEIAKVLFVKVYVERELREKRARENRFTQAYLEGQLGTDPLNTLYGLTREHYQNDHLFDDEASRRINLKRETGFAIVTELESYNLSDTSEDIKGIAFERFLGRTFRGEIGQFFTPRPIVEFMVRMVDPQENEVVCDPASGSGGFLIRAFELMRERITQAVDAEYQAFENQLEGTEAEQARALIEKDAWRRQALDSRVSGSRLWKLSNRCIYGTDANERMARTSKMNMIMHGDGHGGVHHRNGFLNVNGIFEGRFDIILTNPPFGSSVEPSDTVREEDLKLKPDVKEYYEREYGALYTEAQQKLLGAQGKPIASLFDLGGEGKGKIKTEILFLERCLSLLKPGGRLGIVLPEGIFNNPTLAYLRAYCEDRAFLRAVVSLPQETFYASGASVKASLLFLQKFTEEEKARFDALAQAAKAEREAAHQPAKEANLARIAAALKAASVAGDKVAIKALQAEKKSYEKQLDETIATEARALLKVRFSYPVFLYEAEKVGITATGEADLNELYPNPDVPAGLEGQTALELYQQFCRTPDAFVIPEVAV